MLTMTDTNIIKNLRNNYEKSNNEIADVLGIDWCTAKKYSNDAILPEEIGRKKSGMLYDKE